MYHLFLQASWDCRGLFAFYMASYDMDFIIHDEVVSND